MQLKEKKKQKPNHSLILNSLAIKKTLIIKISENHQNKRTLKIKDVNNFLGRC